MSREERPVVAGAAGLLVAYAGVWPRVFLALRAAIGVVWAGACPPFFCCCRCSPVDCVEAKGGGVGCFCSVFIARVRECGFWWL